MKKRKIKYTNLFITVIILYVLVHIVLWVIGYFTKTLVLDVENLELTTKKQGLVIMDEYLINANEDGVVTYNVSDNEKIQKDKLVLSVNKSNKYDDIDGQISKLKQEIKNLEAKNNSVNSNILLNKKEELKILQNKRYNYYFDYNLPTSGIVSFKYDEYSNIKLDDVSSLNQNSLSSIANNFINIQNEKGHEVKSSDTLLRIINPTEVYICIFDKEDIFEENQSVWLDIDGEKVDCNIYKIYRNNDQNTVLIKILEQNESIYNTRIKEFDIIYRKIQGFKIPMESIVKKDNTLGVYVINEETKMPKFTSLGGDYYEDEKYLYLDYNKAKSNINLYDIILLYPNFINQNIKVSR